MIHHQKSDGNNIFATSDCLIKKKISSYYFWSLTPLTFSLISGQREIPIWISILYRYGDLSGQSRTFLIV